MAIRNVLKEGDEILRKVSKPVKVFDESLGQLLDDMKETMHKNEGAGLSAVQVGILKRAFVMQAVEEYYECMNPKILKQEGVNETRIEGCLSVPGKCGYVDRPDIVWVEYQDRTGKVIKNEFHGFEAKCFCHECDHMDGILYVDKATEMFEDREEYYRSQEELDDDDGYFDDIENRVFTRKNTNSNYGKKRGTQRILSNKNKNSKK